LRELLGAPGAFVVIAELVPWRGILGDEKGERALDIARELAADPRIAAISVTDNAGGHSRVSPTTLAEEFVDRGLQTIVHVACRDRNRGALESLGLELASRGMANVLALSGDYPVEGYGGLSKPIFDIDSVALLRMYSDLEMELAGRPLAAGARPFDGFFLGCAVNNHKRHEREVMPQYLKLAMKVRNGADFVISQVGYDARKQDELVRYMRLQGLAVPAIANAYILALGVARAFHDGRVPGCVVSDELFAIVEGEAASPDKGRAFFLEFAARQVAVARGLGYAGIYLSGHRSAAEIDSILRTADSYAPDDWRAFAREMRFGLPGEFHYLAEDRETGLASDVVVEPGAASRSPTRSTGSPTASSSTPRRAASGRPDASTRLPRHDTSASPFTSSRPPPRSRCSIAGTAATARCPTSPTSARSRTARRTSGTDRAAGRPTASARCRAESASGRSPTSG
jgi:methylenetetrahydrofolate reductase (NADPH)